MRKLLNFKAITVLSVVALTLTTLSCRDSKDDEIAAVPEFSHSTTNFYTNKGDSTALRQATVGKWYDESNNLLLDIQAAEVNTSYPVPYPGAYESYFVYRLNSFVQYYPLISANKTNETSRYGNNINLGGVFHLIVEGNSGWLWVMNNTPERIKVVKK